MSKSDFYLDEAVLPGDRYALAVSAGESEVFLERNVFFASEFKGVENPKELHEFIVGRSANKTVVRFNDTHWELVELKLETGYTLHLLKNVSHEVVILQKLKERLRELEGTERFYSEIMEKDLPVGLMITDKDYNVLFANNRLKGFFHIPPRATLLKCYNYVRELSPCKNCILEGLRKGQEQSRKIFETGERSVTAEAQEVEGKYIITFRDTTKEVNLIRQIKEQQENLEKANRMIAEQHDILKRLSNINIRIGQLKDLETLLGMVMDSIKDTFKSARGAILLFNRVGQIEDAHFSGEITDAEREAIIRDVAAPGETTAEELKDYRIMVVGGAEHPIGKLFLYRPEKNVDPSILELFLMQVDIFVDNLKLQGQLEAIAQTDSLTGVFNRYYFDGQFKKETEQSMRFGQPLGLLLADVNGLKEANDKMGHEAGDRLLKETAALIGKNTGDFDTVYRVGGDEFMVLLPNCTEVRLEESINRLKAVQEDAVIRVGDHLIPVRFSLGGACTEGVRHEELKDTADKRMYRDKEEFYKTRRRYR